MLRCVYGLERCESTIDCKQHFICTHRVLQSLATDVCGMLHIDRASFQNYLQSFSTALHFLAGHLMSKVVGRADWLEGGMGNSEGHKLFAQLATSTLEE